MCLLLWVKSSIVNRSDFNQALFSEQSGSWWPWIMSFHASYSPVISYRCWSFAAPCFSWLSFFSLVVILSSIGGWEKIWQKNKLLYTSAAYFSIRLLRWLDVLNFIRAISCVTQAIQPRLRWDISWQTFRNGTWSISLKSPRCRCQVLRGMHVMSVKISLLPRLVTDGYQSKRAHRKWVSSWLLHSIAS